MTIGPENINGTLKGNPEQGFTTIRVNDPGLVKEMDERKVSYSGWSSNTSKSFIPRVFKKY